MTVGIPSWCFECAAGVRARAALATAAPDLILTQDRHWVPELVRRAGGPTRRPQCPSVAARLPGVPLVAIDSASYVVMAGPALVDGIGAPAWALHPDAVAPPPADRIAFAQFTAGPPRRMGIPARTVGPHGTPVIIGSGRAAAARTVPPPRDARAGVLAISHDTTPLARWADRAIDL